MRYIWTQNTEEITNNGKSRSRSRVADSPFYIFLAVAFKMCKRSWERSSSVNMLSLENGNQYMELKGIHRGKKRSGRSSMWLCGFKDTADVCLEMSISSPLLCRVFLLVIELHAAELMVIQECIMKNSTLDSSSPKQLLRRLSEVTWKKTCVKCTTSY